MRTVAYCRPGSKSKGITAVEVLVALLIVFVLAAIIFPVLAKSVRQGHVGNDIENMKSMGVAASLYQSDYDNVVVNNFSTLVSARYLAPEILSSNRDWREDGIGNYIFDQINSKRSDPRLQQKHDRFPGKLSYASQHEYFISIKMQQMIHECNGGWAIDPNELKPDEVSGAYTMPTGGLRRLNYDGSVVQQSVSPTTEGNSRYFFPPLLYVKHCEPMNEWIEKNRH